MIDGWSELTGEIVQMPSITGLNPIDQARLDYLIKLWTYKISKNAIRREYYRQKNLLKNLNIAIPPALTNLEAALGWPAKAVDMLAVRSRFDGFVTPENAGDAVNDILEQNNFRMVYHQAVTSELIHSCAFITVSGGNVAAGEPEVLLSAYSAETAAAVWSMRKKRIDYGMTVVDIDPKTRVPLQINLYTDTDIIVMTCQDSTNQMWDIRYTPHTQGRPLMEPLVYRPELDRPFGKSRISRAVRSITDNAVRTAVRSEVAAEFFTSPQKYLLGTSDDPTFKGSKWDAYLGNIFTATKDEDGDTPEFGQLSQMSMQPHTDYMRSLAAQFSGETNIPISSLGVISDNPSSAEAIYAAKEDLIIEAESLNETNGAALKNIGRLIVAMLENKTLRELTTNEKNIQPRFRNPAIPSVVSQSDAIIKQISAIPWLAQSQVALEELGYTEDQIIRLESDKRKYDAQQTLAKVQNQKATQNAAVPAQNAQNDENGQGNGEAPNNEGGSVNA